MTTIEDQAVRALLEMRKHPGDVVTLQIPRTHFMAASVNLVFGTKTSFMGMDPVLLSMKAAAAGIKIEVASVPHADDYQTHDLS
jgi:hypothetical protein